MAFKRKITVGELLISRLSGGDLKAYSELYVLFSKKIYHTARKMKLSHEDSEEVVQDVFLKIWDVRQNLDPTLSINAYMLTMVKSLVLNKIRKEAYFTAFKKYNLYTTSEASSETESELIFEDLHQHSLELIETLPTEQKRIFYLRYFQYLTADEISDQLQISKRTVENHLYRATKTIKRQLEEMKIICTPTWLAITLFIFS